MKNKQEFIGMELEITQSNNQSLIGLKGKVVDETKNTFVIDDKTILKKNNEFKINNQAIDGNEINMRPEDRIK